MKTSSKHTKAKTGSKKHAGSESMNKLFEDQLKDLYWAEKELSRFMPKLVKQISSKELVKALEEHMKITEKQIKRLDSVFELIGSKAQGENCPAMEGLIEEAENIMQSTKQGVIRDAFIIGAVQKVEHYEMASYGTLKAIAGLMGEFEVASLLGETLEEEKEADLKLTDVAENVVNIEASREAGEFEDEEEEEEVEELDEEEFEEENDDEEEPAGRSNKSKSKQFSSKH